MKPPTAAELERLIAESRSKARAEHEREQELEPTPEPVPEPKRGAMAKVLGLFRRQS